MTFKPGKSGNPKGRPPAGKAVKELQRLSYAQFIDYLNFCGKMSRAEMVDWLARPGASMFELMFGNLIAQAARGDKVAMEMILNRLYGRSVESIQIDMPSPTVIRLRNGEVIRMGIPDEIEGEATDVKGK